MHTRFNGRVEESVMEVQVEMEAIPMDTLALRCTTEALERGAELLAERPYISSTSECPAHVLHAPPK